MFQRSGPPEPTPPNRSSFGFPFERRPKEYPSRERSSHSPMLSSDSPYHSISRVPFPIGLRGTSAILSVNVPAVGKQMPKLQYSNAVALVEYCVNASA